MNNDLLRLLPKVDEVLTDERISALLDRIPRNKVVGSVRSVIDGKRQQILDGTGVHALHPIELLYRSVRV